MSKVSRRKETTARLLRGTRFFVRDERGAIAVIFALMLAALLGVMALSFDLGRVWNLDTELQHAADACALAGVTQLDGSDGARGRAIEACISELARNQQKFATDGAGVDVTFDSRKDVDGGTGKTINTDIKFYSVYPLDPANEATSDAEAKFIEANVAPREVDFSFAALTGAVSSASPTARAVAGWETLYCDIPSIMMCNPAEGPEDPTPDDGNNDEFDVFDDCEDNGIGHNSCIGRGITLKEKSGSGQLLPGEFAWLSLVVELPDGTQKIVTSASELREALASIDYPGTSCTGNNVVTRPGQVTSVGAYINMRFDIFKDVDSQNEPNYRPSLNPVKGLMLPTTAGGDPDWAATSNQCRCNVVGGGGCDSGSSDWKKPEDLDDTLYGSYEGPGMHWDEGVDTYDLAYNSDPALNKKIDAMNYTRDFCAYTDSALGSPTDQFDLDGVVAQYDLSGGASDVLLGRNGCVFVAPPGDNVTPEGKQIGSGQWDIWTYLKVYHGVDVPPVQPTTEIGWQTLLGGAPYNFDVSELTCRRCNDLHAPLYPARWEIHWWEMTNVGGTYPNLPTSGNTNFNTVGPVCYDHTTGPLDLAAYDSEDTRLRLILPIAVVNCGQIQGGGRKQVPLADRHPILAVMLTEPLGGFSANAIYGEIVDPTGLNLEDEEVEPLNIRERILLLE